MNYSRYHIGDYFTNYTTTGLEDLLTSGPLHGPLSTIKTDDQTKIQSWSYLVSLKDRFWGPVLFLIFINDLPDNIRSSVR